MIVVLQASLAWLVVVMFLNRTKRVSQTTGYTWFFIILWSIVMTIQIDTVATLTNQWTGINRLSWLISYVTGLTALYFLYRALCIMLNPSAPKLNRGLYYGFVATLVLLIVVFPSVSGEAGTGNFYTLPILFFRAIPFFYAAILITMTANVLYQCQDEQDPLHLRVRWVVLSVVMFVGSLYFWVRSPYIALVYFFPEILYTQFAGYITETILPYLEFTRAGWICFFIPINVYRELCRPFVFADRYFTLRELERLRDELIALLALNVRLPVNFTWQKRAREIGLLQYQAVFVIEEGRRRLESLVAEGAIPEEENFRYTLLVELFDPIQDDFDFETLVAAYRQASKQYCQSLAAQGYELLPKARQNHPETGGQFDPVAEAEAALGQANRIVHSLELDFDQFSLEDFVRRLEQLKGRKIYLFSFPLPETLYGTWFSDKELPHEYIFYNKSLSSLQQGHVQLHEIGHFLCGHETTKITTENLAAALKTSSIAPIEGFLKYDPYTTPEKKKCEVEAEAIAMVTQAQVVESPKWLAMISSKDEVESFLYEMGLKDQKPLSLR